MSAKITKKMDKKIDKLSFQWKIIINAESINEEMKTQLNKIQAKVHLDGFRQGKAPLDVVEKRYGEEALYRSVNTLIRNTINEIITEEKYRLAMQPEISFSGEIKKNEDVVIYVKIVQKPEIPEIKYDKIEVDVCELELSDEDKQEEYENFRNKMAKQKLVEGEKNIEKGDMVDIDFVGRTTNDNVEFSGGSAKGYKLEIGSKSFIDGFEDQIIGHKKGDNFDITVTFPADYHANDLSGKEAIFNTTINEVYTKELPDLDDEFAKSLGFKTIEEIKNLLTSNLKNYYDNNAKQIIKDKIFSLMIEKNKFDLPESVIEKEINDILDKEKEKNKDNKSFDEKKEKEKITKQLNKSYSSFYLTDWIAEQNSFEISDDEMKQVVSQDAIRNGMDVKEALDKFEKDDKVKNYVYFTIKEAKVYNYIFEHIKKNIKKLDKKSFEKYIEEEVKQAKN